MSLRTLYLAVGAAWGVLLGALAGFGARVYLAGAGGPSLLGGETGPAVAERDLPVAAVLAALATVAAGTAVGWIAGGRVAGGADRRRGRLIGLGLLGLWMVAAAGLAGVTLHGGKREVADRGTIVAQEAAFSRLMADRHTVERVDFFGWNAESGTAGIVLTGARDGDYLIGWQITEPQSGEVLAEGRETVTLEHGRRIVVIHLDMASLITAYREAVLPIVGKTTVDEAFRLTATVEPVLSDDERASVPAREAEALDAGQSILRSTGDVDVPVSFRLSLAQSANSH